MDWADDAEGPVSLALSENGDGTGAFTVERSLGDDGVFEATVSGGRCASYATSCSSG